MATNLVKNLFRKISFREAGRKTQSGGKGRPGGMESLVESLGEDPLNARLHLELADYATKMEKPYLAFAELKSAQFLGEGGPAFDRKLQARRQALPDPKSMNHNQYFRFVSLSAEFLKRAGSSGVSVLDLGGGNGELASFIPDVSYCLAEPTVNGISGIDLPFADKSFDYVVSCHVLEHIPVEHRETFLDQLLRIARRGVVLLNPFHVEGTYVEERLKLFVDITGAQWAKEHLDCSLPEVSLIETYASKNGLEFEVVPNGCITTSVALVFVDYFAEKSGLIDEWHKFNQFFNRYYTEIHGSSAYPNAYLMYLGWPETKQQVA